MTTGSAGLGIDGGWNLLCWLSAGHSTLIHLTKLFAKRCCTPIPGTTGASFQASVVTQLGQHGPLLLARGRIKLHLDSVIHLPRVMCSLALLVVNTCVIEQQTCKN
jgi:hypothetical protein